MSYIKQTWVDGDIVTAEKMNHIEDGIEAGGVDTTGVLFVTIGALPNATGYEFSLTYNQISSAIGNGQSVIAKFNTRGSDNKISLTEYFSLYSVNWENEDISFVKDTFNSYASPPYVEREQFTLNKNNVVTRFVNRIYGNSQ